jgi:HEAT repeat protein
MAAAKDTTKDQNARVAAIVLAGKLNDEGANRDIENILEKDANAYCREAAAIALGHSGDKQAIPKLKQAMKDSSGNARMRAVWALAKMGDTSGKQLALEAIKGKDVTAQMLAVDALEMIGDKDAIPELKKNLDSGSSWARIHSMLAIKRLEIKDLSGNERLSYFRETLKDKQFEVSKWAVTELLKTGTPEAIRILKEAAKDPSTKGSYTAKRAVKAFEKQGNVKAEEHGK